MRKKTSKVKPISPLDLIKKQEVPNEVIEAFNALIKKNWYGYLANVKQDEVIELIIKNFEANGEEINREDVFHRSYLNIEDIYNKAGWDVKYNKAGIDDHWESYFCFKHRDFLDNARRMI